jgi:predicted transcriptional regulator
MLNPASEVIVNELLPALRSVVARELYSRGYSQSEIAEMMDLTQPAVSQYLNKVRGAGVEVIQDDDVLARLASEIAGSLSRHERDAVRQAYAEFCRRVVEEGILQELGSSEKRCFADF